MTAGQRRPPLHAGRIGPRRATILIRPLPPLCAICGGVTVDGELCLACLATEALPCALCGARAESVCGRCGDRICGAEGCLAIHDHAPLALVPPEVQ